MDEKRVIWLLVVLALLANIFDIVTTLIGISLGYKEANFIPGILLDISPYIFIWVKFFIVLFAIYLVLPFKYCPFYYLIKYGIVGNWYRYVSIILLSLIILYFGYLGINNLILIF